MGVDDPVGPRDIEVSRDDQNRINEYSRMNQKYQELEKDIEGYKDTVRTYTDALEEVLLCMDPEGIKMRFGETFFPAADLDVTERVEGLKSELEAKLSTTTDEIETISTKMDAMKKILYAKFGESINLESR
eukprot:GEMP01094937.1.p1 GENE.GEMP01094937.1~~GEMP01094937.1.p1  ORF type:complete len:131 (+),score=30.04 GEMP01094937.1:71-463(+)